MPSCVVPVVALRTMLGSDGEVDLTQPESDAKMMDKEDSGSED